MVQLGADGALARNDALGDRGYGMRRGREGAHCCFKTLTWPNDPPTTTLGISAEEHFTMLIFYVQQKLFAYTTMRRYRYSVSPSNNVTIVTQDHYM